MEQLLGPCAPAKTPGIITVLSALTAPEQTPTGCAFRPPLRSGGSVQCAVEARKPGAFASLGNSRDVGVNTPNHLARRFSDFFPVHNFLDN